MWARAGTPIAKSMQLLRGITDNQDDPDWRSSMSDLAQQTPTTQTATPTSSGGGGAPPAAPLAPEPLAVAAQSGGGGTPTGPSPFADMYGGPANKYSVQGKDSSQGLAPGKWPEYQKWDAWGSGQGNRKGDLPDDKGKVKNATASAPKVAQADLKGIATTTTTGQKDGELGGGTYHDSTFGTVVEGGAKGFKPSVKYDPMKGDKSLDIYSARAAAGMREKVGVRGMARAEGDLGSAQAKGDAYAVGELGADAYGKINTKDGLVAGANASGKLGVGFSGDADLKTPGLKIDGVDTPLDAGVGVHADGFAGVKVGAGGRVGLGPQFIGAEGSIGAFAGVEAQGDIHANLGPVRGKLGGSVMAGAGIGADGGIVYEDGKIRIGGKLYAALGYGASVSGEVTLDVRQAAQLAMAAGKKAYQIADGDGDGKLTLNDPATHLASAAKGGAKLLDKGATGLINFLDADGSGKFSQKDLEIRMKQAGDALGDAKDRVLEGGKALLDKGHKALDRDGDGKLGLGDVTAGAGELKDAAMKKVGEVGDAIKSGAKAVHGALDHDGDGKLELSDVKGHLGDAGKALMDTGKSVVDGVKNLGEKAGHAVHDALDADGDGKLTMGDAATMGKKAYQGMAEAGREVVGHAKEAIQGVHDALDLNNDGKVDSKDAMAAGKKVADTAKAAKKAAVDTFNKTVAAGVKQFEAAKKKAVAIGEAAHKAADRDGDGKLGWGDVKAGAGQAASAVASGAKKVADAAHKAADRDGDGKLGWGDVKAGAGEVAGAVASRAKDAYEGAKAQVTQAAATLRDGISSAASSVKGTWNKVSNFFGW
jgi:hypothetical protein